MQNPLQNPQQDPQPDIPVLIDSLISEPSPEGEQTDTQTLIDSLLTIAEMSDEELLAQIKSWNAEVDAELPDFSALNAENDAIFRELFGDPTGESLPGDDFGN